MNQLTSRAEYEEFIYGLQPQFPAIAYSTLLVVRRGVGTLQVRGEIIFSGGVRLIVAERLMLDGRILRIVSYGYEVWRGAEKLYWYDSQPHPDTRSNLPFLIAEIEQDLLKVPLP